MSNVTRKQFTVVIPRTCRTQARLLCHLVSLLCASTICSALSLVEAQSEYQPVTPTLEVFLCCQQQRTRHATQQTNQEVTSEIMRALPKPPVWQQGQILPKRTETHRTETRMP